MLKTISVIHPKPLEEVGQKFKVVGLVPKSWLMTSWGSIDDRLFTNLIDIDGQTFAGGTLFVRRPKGILGWFTKMYEFGQIEEFSQFNVAFIEKSQGRITLQIFGHDEDSHSIFIPLLVLHFIPEGLVDSVLTEKHLNVGKRILQLKKDLKEYNKELAALMEKERAEFDSNFVEDAEGIEVQSEELLDGVAWMLYSAESDEKRTLDEKYKEAIEWRGPLLRGIAARMKGFVFKVHSHDHGQHFHVIHKERGVDVRFSFPEIQLESYKNTRNIIGSKEIEQIREFLLQPENFKKLKKEFDKREVIA